MGKSIVIRNFKSSDIEEMHRCFLSAFSDYEVPFEMNLAGFRKKFIEKLSIDFECSAGAYSDGKLVGFIFMTLNEYEGLKTAYNGGTGVIPDFRGQKITSRLWTYIKSRLVARNVQKSILEVLTTNNPAIKIYEDLGFRKVKHFKCYRLLPYRYSTAGNLNHSIEIKASHEPRWGEYAAFFDYSPSFIDSQSMISRNIANENILEAYLDGELVGYIIFQAPIGRISHLAVSGSHRNKGIGTRLISEAYKASKNKYLTVINLPEPAKDIQKFLMDLGFENQLDQFEMSLLLN